MWLGFKWSRGDASGIQSIIWRMNWEQTSDGSCKDDLSTYNVDDGRALQILVDVLVRLCSPDIRPNLENGTEPTAVLAESSSSRATLWGRFKTPVADFEIINKAARWDSQRDKVFVRVGTNLKRIRFSAPKTDIRITKVNNDVWLPPMQVCPFCATKLQRHGSWQKIIYDIRFSRFGLRRWVVRHRFAYCGCPQCKKFFGLPDELARWGMFGRNVAMFVVYQTVDLCLPLRSLFQYLNRLFGFGLQDAHVHRLKARAAEYFSPARDNILERMMRGTVIHADETPVVLKHKRAYVWVFATFDAVAYFYAETREGSFMQDKLKEFKGVLVSDFYSPYDALPCPQQKCLIHLIRDLNDAVLNYPFDEELKAMVAGFGELVRTIVSTIDRWGLRRRFLGKHLPDVQRFYRRLDNTTYHSEAAKKWQERFVKNRSGLFTFLSYDGVPWNNNNAEHAIKAFARLRRTIAPFRQKRRLCFRRKSAKATTATHPPSSQFVSGRWQSEVIRTSAIAIAVSHSAAAVESKKPVDFDTKQRAVSACSRPFRRSSFTEGQIAQN